MNTSILELLPPDMLEAERERLPWPADHADPNALAPALLAPLAARAHGDAMFPQHALGDANAARMLKALRADVSHLLASRAAVYGVLARTQVLHSLAQRFFERSPRSTGVSLGAGLGHYFQWLDRGTNQWIDADVPAVTALRERLLPGIDEGRRNVAVDLAQPGWWQRLGLPGRHPAGPREPPVLLVCEGVLMSMAPHQVQAVLREIGANAPPGSRVLLDTMFSLSMGPKPGRPRVLRTGARDLQAPVHWAPRHWSELTAPHPRLRLDGQHTVMEAYGLPYSALGPLCRLVFGVPFYAVADIGVDA